MSELKQQYFDTIIKYVNILCPNKRTPKYSNEYYLTNILTLLKDFVSWRSLRMSIFYKKGTLTNKSKDIISKDNHYKTICAKHVLWSKKKIYEKAYYEIMKKNISGKGDQLQVIIDATNINNKSGREAVGYGSETKKKRFTKITVLSDNKANLISILPHNTTSKDITFKNSSKKVIIQTLEHDTKAILPAIKNLNTKKAVIVTGDLGYLVSDENKKLLKDQNNITLITPYRKNQRKKNTTEERNFLKTRYKVENAISKLKRFNRTTIRRDHKLCTFMGFIYISFLYSI